MEDGPTRYGRLKAGCERAAELVFGAGRVTLPRLGVVLGPGEYVVPWWLRRVWAGGRVVAPGSPSRCVQLIDARDVAGFILDCVAAGRSGPFNVTGPMDRDSFADLLEVCRAVTGSQAELVWVPDQRLVALGVRQWSELPLWRTQAGVWRVDTAAATVAGLRCRPLAETVAATWTWLASGSGPTVNERMAEIGLSPQREREILAAVDQSPGGR